jgi:hypothetical protein
MRLLILDNSPYPLNFETAEFIRQLGKDKVTVYNDREDLYKNTDYSKIIKKFNVESFIQDQSNFDAVYITNTRDTLKGVYKIPYFFNIYSHTWDTSHELEYKNFENRYSQLKGAGAVFVNDRILNKYSHWLGLNSYYLNKPINTYHYKFDKYKKFLTPKLNIGFIPAVDKYSQRNNIFKKVVESSKSNWIFHIPDGNFLDFYHPNLIKHKINKLEGSDLDYSEIYKNSQVLFNPEDPKTDQDFTFEEECYQAMACGVIVLKTNFHNNNSETLFDNVNFFKIEYLKLENILEDIRYLDKRREKLSKMSKMSYEYVYKYADVRKIVQNKIMVIKNSI